MRLHAATTQTESACARMLPNRKRANVQQTIWREKTFDFKIDLNRRKRRRRGTRPCVGIHVGIRVGILVGIDICCDISEYKKNYSA